MTTTGTVSRMTRFTAAEAPVSSEMLVIIRYSEATIPAVARIGAIIVRQMPSCVLFRLK